MDDLLVEVEDAVAAQAGPVRLDGGGEAGRVGLDLDLVGVAQAEADDREALEVRRHRIGVEPVRQLRQVGLEPAAHLALVDEVGTPSGVAADQLVAERVERLDPGPQAAGASRHLLLGLAVVGHGEEQVALVAPVGEEVAEPLGEDPRLAGPGGGDDAGRSAPVGDGGQLVGCELGPRLDPGRHRAQVPGVDRLGPHQHGRGQDGGVDVVGWPAVDPRDGAVGEQDVAVDRVAPLGDRRLRCPRCGRPCDPTTRSVTRPARRSCCARRGSGAGRATARTSGRAPTAPASTSRAVGTGPGRRAGPPPAAVARSRRRGGAGPPPPVGRGPRRRRRRPGHRPTPPAVRHRRPRRRCGRAGRDRTAASDRS